MCAKLIKEGRSDGERDGERGTCARECVLLIERGGREGERERVRI
jgi:hypothetical protein